MMKFNKSKLAAAIGAAALATSMQAGAVVVVGGDNGWEISFDGTINLFYNQIDWERTSKGNNVSRTTNTILGQTGTQDSAHLNEGLLPAFFSFNAKSPTVNGLTGTARISFAPDSSSAKNTRQDKSGAAIDMREVVVNVDGSFGTISFGRTLGLFSRQAILKDQTLFGVGAVAGPDAGGTTLGRIGYGYIYPEFRTRFAYKTPNMNGFQLEVGLFDPQEPFGAQGAANLVETDTPMFQAEATYSTAVGEGNVNLWLGGLWQEDDVNISAGTTDDTVTHWGVDVGGQATYMGFELVGHYYTGEALGTSLKWLGAGGATGSAGGLLGGIGLAEGFVCGNPTATTTSCQEADNDGFYVQLGYTFNGKTKIAGSYGESTQDGELGDGSIVATTAQMFNDVENTMWTIGVYHDVNSWLKLVAEYNNQDIEVTCSAVGVGACPANGKVAGMEADTFSVGAFMFW